MHIKGPVDLLFKIKFKTCVSIKDYFYFHEEYMGILDLNFIAFLSQFYTLTYSDIFHVRFKLMVL
jgi:hypothetical protein